MKKTSLLILVSFLSFTILSQTVKREYYDYRKTQIMAKYQVNSVGEKNGWFKGYDREGILIYDYNYKNNLWHGTNKVYTTYGGSRTLDKTESYKLGILDGPAAYYVEDGKGIGRYAKSKGSYKNGEKNGKWTFISSYDNYGMSDKWAKVSEFITFNKFYENGTEIYPDGEHKIYFLPSKKIQATYQFSNNYKSGIWSTYHPSGQILETITYKNGKPVGNHIIYNADGSIKSKKFYEDYEALSDLYKDSAMTAFKNHDFETAEKFFKKMKSSDARIMNDMAKAKTNREQKHYVESIKNIKSAVAGIENDIIMDYYLQVYKEYIIDIDTKFDFLLKEEKTKEIRLEFLDYEDAFNDGILNKEDFEKYKKLYGDYERALFEKEAELAAEKKRKEEELAKLNSDISIALDLYKSDNVKQVETFFVDENGKAIMKDSFIKGKNLYKKSMLVLDPLIKEFNNETNLESKKILGKSILDKLELLNKIPKSDWKKLNKKLKKTEDLEEIKVILNI